MPFQTQWFDQNIPYWQQYLHRFKDKPNLKFLELGCFEGRATKWLLTHILTDSTSKIIVVDTFEGSPEFSLGNIDASNLEATFMKNVAKHKKKVEVWKGRTELIDKADYNQFDFIYVDASHQAIDVLHDGVMSFNLLKPGGSIIFDDYTWAPELSVRERPHKAIQALIDIWGGYYGTWKFWIDQAAFTRYL